MTKKRIIIGTSILIGFLCLLALRLRPRTVEDQPLPPWPEEALRALQMSESPFFDPSPSSNWCCSEQRCWGPATSNDCDLLFSDLPTCLNACGTIETTETGATIENSEQALPSVDLTLHAAEQAESSSAESPAMLWQQIRVNEKWVAMTCDEGCLLLEPTQGCLSGNVTAPHILNDTETRGYSCCCPELSSSAESMN
ncbi:MAG: hypothetical protein PHI23_00565 [Candidatus Peribacteraceae bacterium]|nr:hypothetical protein [Candidatus Peribacteraceae bacterium]